MGKDMKNMVEGSGEGAEPLVDAVKGDGEVLVSGERVTDHNEALVEVYGRFAPVMEYLLVLDEDPREGRVVTTRVRELWAAQDEKGPKGLFAGALSTTTTVGRLKYVLFAIPEGLEHHSLLEVVDEVAYRAAADEDAAGHFLCGFGAAGGVGGAICRGGGVFGESV